MQSRPSSLRRLRVLVPAGAIILALFALLGFAAASSDNPKSDDHVENTDQAIAFRNDMRKLWEDHITWTRLAIISLAGDLPDTSATVDRLLSNQDDIGNAIAPFYGQAAGQRLTALLKDHIQVAAQLILAAKAGDSEGVTAASAAWYANANDIAAFLNAANPQNWPLEHMQDMMREHLDLTLAEAQARLAGDYPADVAAYDRVHDAILSMSDMLSLGIIDQFPKRFR